MSKVNIDEIRVGDLVAFDRYHTYKSYSIGLVNRIDGDKFWCNWSSSSKDYEGFVRYNDITGHWKVINFDELPDSPYTEEEKQMDELKVYTGKETLQALLEGKVLKEEDYGTQYKIKDDEFLAKPDNSKDWKASILQFDGVLKFKFTEVVTPQVGDWVRVKFLGELACVAQIDSLDGDKMWAKWTKGKSYYRTSEVDWEILSPEQVSEHKRKQVFAKVGRKPNEFKESDIAYVEALGVMAVVVSHNNDQEVRLHKINKREGLTAKPHQLTPISFVEQQVDLS